LLLLLLLLLCICLHCHAALLSSLPPAARALQPAERPLRNNTPPAQPWSGQLQGRHAPPSVSPSSRGACSLTPHQPPAGPWPSRQLQAMGGSTSKQLPRRPPCSCACLLRTWATAIGRRVTASPGRGAALASSRRRNRRRRRGSLLGRQRAGRGVSGHQNRPNLGDDLGDLHGWLG